MRRILVVLALATGAILGGSFAPSALAGGGINCEVSRQLCTEIAKPLGYYSGHDEPSLLFYSDTAGAGNSNTYYLRLPADPATPPSQSGKGTTWNFQLHPAFWFGMALCDPESFPEYTKKCVPDSDTNIANSGDPRAADFIGKHSGTAFMEMQFYPPGWSAWPAGVSCAAKKWCAALNIDSLSVDGANGKELNPTCESVVGVEYVNFAFITKSGVAHAPANPIDATLSTYTPNAGTDLFMGSGDLLKVDMFDTPAGFKVVIDDLTSGQSGSMTASTANKFATVKYAPAPSTKCKALPYAFHPMYSTSSTETRVPWAAHSYNVAFSDEIGHFEYCNATPGGGGPCTSPGGADGSLDADDDYCFSAIESLLAPITGCFATDDDFDGPEYHNTWPGTADPSKVPDPIEFTSPLYNGTEQYDRVAFETDLAAIEASCDGITGAGCTNPPAGSKFYPIFTTAGHAPHCVWHLGGTDIPGTTNDFGGDSASEYRPLLALRYQTGPTTTGFFYEDYRNILGSNPCGTH